MKALDILGTTLVLVGALNWGLVGIAHFNLVAALFGQTVVASTVYALVGLAAVYEVWRIAASRKHAIVTV